MSTTPNFAGEWIGQIANHPSKIKFEKTTDSNMWVGTMKVADKWVLLQSVEYDTTENKLVFTIFNGGRCECYASDYLMTGAYYPEGMMTRSAPMGFQLGKVLLPKYVCTSP